MGRLRSELHYDRTRFFVRRWKQTERPHRIVASIERYAVACARVRRPRRKIDRAFDDVAIGVELEEQRQSERRDVAWLGPGNQHVATRIRGDAGERPHGEARSAPDVVAGSV